MKHSNKRLIFSIVLICSIAMLVFGWPIIAIVVKVATGIRHSNRERTQLLFQTDHQLLLSACRELMANRTNYAPDQFMHNMQSREKTYLDPAGPKIPAVVSQLKPTYIIATDSNVELDLHGGFEHYGAVALAETITHGTTNIPPGGPFELIPGLWYYDEGLSHNRALWLKKLKNLRPPNTPEPAWR